MPAKPVTLAAIVGAHGLTGEVRLKLFTGDVSSLKAHKSFNEGTLTLKSIRPGNAVIARFAEITDRNAADAARGTALTVPRDALPPLGQDEYYHTDLIDFTCLSTDGEDLGVCVAVENFGAGDVLEIERPGGDRFMVPMTADAVPEWGDRIVVDAAFAA
jgi:16S rRNA processing protein RimM